MNFKCIFLHKTFVYVQQSKPVLMLTCTQNSSDYKRSEREPFLLPRLTHKGRVMPPNNNTHIGPRCPCSACLWPCVYELGLFWVYSHYILLGEIKWPCLESRCPPDWLLLDSHAHGVGKLMKGFGLQPKSSGKRKLEKEKSSGRWIEEKY